MNKRKILFKSYCMVFIEGQVKLSSASACSAAGVVQSSGCEPWVVARVECRPSAALLTSTEVTGLRLKIL